MADSQQYLTLGLAAEVLALPVQQVREILEVLPVARLPHAPAHLLGMIDVRGQSVPVIDLALLLGLEVRGDTESTRIVVIETGDAGELTVFGAKADRVFEVTVLDSAELEAAPQIGGRWRRDVLAGIGRCNGAFVVVLDPARLLDAEQSASLSADAA